MAQYLIYGTRPYEEVTELAADLRATAERSGVLRAVGFVSALRLAQAARLYEVAGHLLDAQRCRTAAR